MFRFKKTVSLPSNTFPVVTAPAYRIAKPQRSLSQRIFRSDSFSLSPAPARRRALSAPSVFVSLKAHARSLSAPSTTPIQPKLDTGFERRAIAAVKYANKTYGQSVSLQDVLANLKKDGLLFDNKRLQRRATTTQLQAAARGAALGRFSVSQSNNLSAKFGAGFSFEVYTALAKVRVEKPEWSRPTSVRDSMVIHPEQLARLKLRIALGIKSPPATILASFQAYATSRHITDPHELADALEWLDATLAPAEQMRNAGRGYMGAEFAFLLHELRMTDHGIAEAFDLAQMHIIGGYFESTFIIRP